MIKIIQHKLVRLLLNHYSILFVFMLLYLLTNFVVIINVYFFNDDISMNFKLNLFLLMLIFGCKLLAQDRIVTKDGNTLDVYNVEVASNFVFYSEQNSADADIQKMKKDDILMIRFQDGSRKIFTDGVAEESETEEKQVVLSEESIVKDYSIPAEENEKLKEKYRVPVEYVKEPSNKEAKSFYCQFDFCKDAVLADKNLEIELKTIKDVGPRWIWLDANFTLSINLKNKTSQIIYVDLGNSFFIRGDEASPLYTPSSTSVTDGASGGVGVNVGSMTNALGVGGVVGTLAQGITVGGGKSQSSTTVTYSQRYISVPPMSSVTLESQLMFLPGKEYGGNIRCEERKSFACVFMKEFGLKRGETINWDENSTPIKIKSYINYSLDSGFSNTGHINTSLYVKKMIGIPKRSGYGSYYSTIDHFSLSENYLQSLFFTGGFSKY